jgi:hypothetical protein
LKQMGVNAASLEAGIERANSAIEKLTEAKKSVRPPVLPAACLSVCLSACLSVCLPGQLAGWPRRHFSSYSHPTASRCCRSGRLSTLAQSIPG